jgi:hypothetical protein
LPDNLIVDHFVSMHQHIAKTDDLSIIHYLVCEIDVDFLQSTECFPYDNVKTFDSGSKQLVRW